MPNDRTETGTPQAELPEAQGQVKPLAPSQVPLTVRLGPVVDKIRQLNTRFGLRPYRVFLVHVMYGGSGRRGEGQPTEISRREILPTPNVVDMQATTEVMRSFGLTEEGGLTITQISTKYSEDDLMGRTPDLNDPTMPRTGLRNVDFFWEVVELRASNPTSVPRRYVPNAVPMLGRDQFQWRVTLTKQDFNRSRGLTPDRTLA